MDWSLEDPSTIEGDPAEVRAAYEAAFEHVSSHIHDLVEAVIGNRSR